jgi:hypothetical protein
MNICEERLGTKIIYAGQLYYGDKIISVKLIR